MFLANDSFSGRKAGHSCQPALAISQEQQRKRVVLCEPAQFVTRNCRNPVFISTNDLTFYYDNAKNVAV